MSGQFSAPWTYEVHELSEGMSAIVYDAQGRAVVDHLPEDLARFIATAPEMLRVLRQLQHVLPTLWAVADIDPAGTFVRIRDRSTGGELAKVTLAKMIADQDAVIAAATGAA